MVKGQPETLGLPSLIRQALDQLGLRESSDASIHVVKSGVLAAIVPWSELSVLQVRFLGSILHMGAQRESSQSRSSSSLLISLSTGYARSSCADSCSEAAIVCVFVSLGILRTEQCTPVLACRGSMHATTSTGGHGLTAFKCVGPKAARITLDSCACCSEFQHSSPLVSTPACKRPW